jgi:excisionase family DNA binding protein
MNAFVCSDTVIDFEVLKLLLIVIDYKRYKQLPTNTMSGWVACQARTEVARMEKLYSVEDAAELTRLSHWTIRYWLKTGKLRGTKIGGRRVIRESELQRLIVDDPRPAAKK